MDYPKSFRKNTVTLAAGALAIFSAGTASAQAAPPRTIVAVLSQEDAGFSETITLYSDGKYQQAETQKKTDFYRGYSLHGTVFGSPVFPVALLQPKKEGAWQVLDRDGGQPIAFKTRAALSKEAVVTLKGAMPFGMVWDNQFPYQFSGTRTLPVSSFQDALPAFLNKSTVR